jgi:hypothetical protein
VSRLTEIEGRAAFGELRKADLYALLNIAAVAKEYLSEPGRVYHGAELLFAAVEAFDTGHGSAVPPKSEAS